MSNNLRRTTIGALRRNTDESPVGGITSKSSFRLISSAEPENVDNIKSFQEFKRLRKVYHNLCELPETLFEDWISCCIEHISKDIHGNTNEENQQNVRIGSLFTKFHEDYCVIIDSIESAEERRNQINNSLLCLLRSLLGKPCRLADEIITLTGFPSE